MANKILIPLQSFISCFLKPPANRRAAVSVTEGLWQGLLTSCCPSVVTISGPCTRRSRLGRRVPSSSGAARPALTAFSKEGGPRAAHLHDGLADLPQPVCLLFVVHDCRRSHTLRLRPVRPAPTVPTPSPDQAPNTSSTRARLSQANA